MTITCECGHSEFFAGDLLESHSEAAQSTNWHLTARGFLICAACAEAKKKSEEAA